MGLFNQFSKVIEFYQYTVDCEYLSQWLGAPRCEYELDQDLYEKQSETKMDRAGNWGEKYFAALHFFSPQDLIRSKDISFHFLECTFSLHFLTLCSMHTVASTPDWYI